MFSLGIEPSITSTNGASSSPRTAWRKGSRNSSPPSVGDSTLLWRWTFGIPGIAPSSTSSIPGWPAAVTETESPSQLIPSEIHRMWTSSTPAGASSTAMRDLLLLVHQVERLDPEFLSGDHLDVPAAARGARQGEAVQRAQRAAAATAPVRGHLLEHQLGAVERGALGDELEGEGERRGHHLAQVADGHLHARDPSPRRMTLRDRDDG